MTLPIVDSVGPSLTVAATASASSESGPDRVIKRNPVMNSRAILLTALIMVCAGATGVLAQPDSGDIGATEADYGWWRDARFGIFIHWGPGAFVHKNSLAWETPPDGRPPYRELGYMADVENPDWKLLMWDEGADAPRMPNGSIGDRWAEEDKGHWNLELKDRVTGEDIAPRLSFIDHHDDL